MTSGIRVRFAPSPTGYLHIGGARTALYNWLWAKRHGGTFVLRIEDTDRERSTEQNTQVVLDSMKWLGLDWDEGPFFQMQRLDLYREHTEKLIAKGAAYRCYCTKEDLARAREEQKAKGQPFFKYPGTCRDRSDEPDMPWVLRLRAPTEGAVGWDDLVKGHLEYPNTELQDVVLVRTDGVPLYNFGAFVDDLTMGITLVARGDDHMVNTPIQILLYRALGERVPDMAHLPMILGPDGQKLSKRHAAVAVLDYRERGYLPDAVINYLARLGWSHGDQEVFSRDELIQKFDFTHVGKAGAKYDEKKLHFVQAEHLRGSADAELAALAVPLLEARGIHVEAGDRRLVAAMPYVKPRATTLDDLANAVDYFLRDTPEMEDKGRKKFLVPGKGPLLRDLGDTVAGVEPFDVAHLEPKVNAWVEARGLTLKDFAQSARVALTGRTASPGLFEVMEVLGRDRTLERLERGAELAERQGD